MGCAMVKDKCLSIISDDEDDRGRIQPVSILLDASTIFITNVKIVITRST